MSIENNAPDIRFSEFCAEWANKNIGSILAEKNRPIELMDNESYQLVTVKRRNEGVVPRSILKGINILVKNYFTVKAGDYLVSKRQVVHGANGIVPKTLDNAVVSNEYLVVIDSDEITAQYWAVISNRPEMYKLFFVSSYGVDIEKLVFDVTDWKNRKISFPKVTEQNAITGYFQKLDGLISQHQQKHDKLSNVKKAMLEKMFPKQGEKIPEIRIKGFSGEWVEKAVCDLFAITRGNVLAATETSPLPTPNKRYPVYSSQTKNNGLMGFYDRYLFENAITWTTDGANAGTVKFREGKFFSTNVNGVLLSGEGSANKAVAEILNKEAWKHVSHVGNPKLMNNVMSEITITIPNSAEEQTLIGSYFQKLDALINQHQQQITKLNNIKQACLSKMFV